MKMKKIISGTMAAALVLTGVPAMGWYTETVDAATGTPSVNDTDKVETAKLSGAAASQVNDNTRKVENALDGNLSTFWASKYDESGPKDADGDQELDTNNWYEITIAGGSSVGAVSYIPRQDYANNHLGNGVITKCKVTLLDDQDSPIGEPVIADNWTYLSDQDENYQEINAQEKMIYFPSTQQNVAKIRIEALKTQGSVSGDDNKQFAAAEWGVYSAVTWTEDQVVVPEITLKTPVAGEAPTQATVAEGIKGCTLGTTEWKDGNGNPVTTFENYNTYTATITLNADSDKEFTEADKPTHVMDEEGEHVATATISEDKKTMEVVVSYALNLDYMKLVPDGEGKITISDEQARFFNNMSNLEMTVVLRYDKDKVVDKTPYALFTLDAGDGNNCFTVWHSPLANNVSYASYSYVNNGTKSAGNLFWNANNQLKVEDSKWHKLSFAYSNEYKKWSVAMDDNAAWTNGQNTTGFLPPLFGDTVFSVAKVGAKPDTVTYNTLNSTNNNAMADFNDVGEIKYIEFRDGSYENCTALTSTVQKVVDSGVKKEYDDLAAELADYTKENYTQESWDEFNAAKGTATAVEAEKEWTYCNAIEDLKAAKALLKEATTTVKRTVTVQKDVDAAGTVQKDGVDFTSGTFDDGNVVTLTAAASEGYTFKHWVDVDSDKVISTSPEVKITVVSNRTLKPVFVETGKYEVTFKLGADFANKVVHAGTYDQDVAVNVPDAPQFDGWTFNGWYNGSEKVDGVTVNATASVTYEAQYTKDDEEKYTVYAPVGKIEEYTLGKKFRLGDWVTAICDSTKEIEVNGASQTGHFVGWYETDVYGQNQGAKLSDNLVYKFVVTRDTYVMAVYDVNQPEKSMVPTLALGTNERTFVADTNRNRIKVQVLYDSVAGSDCKVIEKGVLLTWDDAAVNDLKLNSGNDAVKRFYSAGDWQYGSYTLSATLGATTSASKNVYYCGYLTYMDGTGAVQTIYTDTVTKTPVTQ